VKDNIMEFGDENEEEFIGSSKIIVKLRLQELNITTVNINVV
jgi:hypothetical protein